MAYEKNHSKYNLENLKVKSLIIHAKDDKVVDFNKVNNNVCRIKENKFLAIETGGRLLKGNSNLVDQTVRTFISENSEHSN